jgi:hypothetical protein
MPACRSGILPHRVRGAVAPAMSRAGELAITGRRIHRQCLGSTANAIRTVGGCSASAV